MTEQSLERFVFFFIYFNFYLYYTNYNEFDAQIGADLSCFSEGA